MAKSRSDNTKKHEHNPPVGGWIADWARRAMLERIGDECGDDPDRWSCVKAAAKGYKPRKSIDQQRGVALNLIESHAPGIRDCQDSDRAPRVLAMLCELREAIDCPSHESPLVSLASEPVILDALSRYNPRGGARRVGARKLVAMIAVASGCMLEVHARVSPDPAKPDGGRVFLERVREVLRSMGSPKP